MNAALIALAVGFGLAIVSCVVALTLARRRGRRTDNTRDDWDVD